MGKRTKDRDVLALVKACKALEDSSSSHMVVVNLRFLWDRYVARPPAKAWWMDPRAKNPRAVRP